jgi:subtilisin-like proprotein convertase family protein
MTLSSIRTTCCLAVAALLLLIHAARAQVAIGDKQFERSLDERGNKGEWVLYEKNAPRNEATRRWLTKKVLVEVATDLPLVNFSDIPGVIKAERKGRYAVIEFFGDPSAALSGATALQKMKGVDSAKPMLARQLYRRFIPNDAYFAYNNSSKGYQWHLNNTGQNGGTAGVDLNTIDAWDDYDGSGVRIAIVDNGLEVTHPDLAANVDVVNDYDFNDDDTDPSPENGNVHGTACAGIAAAVGNNGIGGSGVAPAATLVGLRLIAEPTTDADEADAFQFEQDIIDIKSNSWGPFDNAYGEGGPGVLSTIALETAATTGRNGKGAIFLWAAGNGNGSGDDSNYDGWANSPYAIAVSAITDSGEQAWYSEPGANILVCAPSNGGSQSITTTDRSGTDGYNSGGSSDYSNTDYTNSFGGTSAATPAAAGVVALLLEANPNLTYRDVQEILVQTATMNDAQEGNWITNGAGFHFNHYFGAGLIDASAATEAAETWVNLTAKQTHSIAALTLNQIIPDGDDDGTTHTFTVPALNSLRLEHVTVQIESTHPYRGQLEWRLISPSGVNVRLARSRGNDTSSDLDWTFMTTHFWGEHSEGDWKLQVTDRSIANEGTLDAATITFHGTSITGGLPLPVITSDFVIVTIEDAPLNYQLTASNAVTTYSAIGLPTGTSIDTATGLITGVPIATGDYYTSLSATNATGTTTETVRFYIIEADPQLAEAVDQPSTTKIVSFGGSHWFLQSAHTDDGVDAAQSGLTADGKFSGMEFNVEGPVALDFKWKVSSEANYDYLVFTVDGSLKGYISGEVDWTTVTEYLGTGTHRIDIYYLKDETESDGDDTGWVDRMTITAITSAPELTVEPIQAYVGVAFQYQILSSHAPTFTSTTLPSGVTLHPSGRLHGSMATPGSYSITVSATNEIGTDTETFQLQVGTLLQGLAEAIDAPAQVMTTSGDSTWIPQAIYSSDGVDAARSGGLDNESESIMSTEVTGPCKINFYWGISSEEDYDFLLFYIDDVEQAAISGDIGWTAQSYIITEGTHTIKWIYRKDQFTRAGLDSGFVDQFVIYPDTDRDGFYADMEAHFGTSDSDASTTPKATASYSSSGLDLLFPSVVGHEYYIEYSEDLLEWDGLTITATENPTIWQDPSATGKSKQFYRVSVPK